jgi:hypothetical protein
MPKGDCARCGGLYISGRTTSGALFGRLTLDKRQWRPLRRARAIGCNQSDAISGGNFAARSAINCAIHKWRQIPQDRGMLQQGNLTQGPRNRLDGPNVGVLQRR